jgi:hypothetical protein
MVVWQESISYGHTAHHQIDKLPLERIFLMIFSQKPIAGSAYDFSETIIYLLVSIQSNWPPHPQISTPGLDHKT